jgi:murein DD-endopeptidase MepM/ murein hydrolase activator NlpD
LELAALGETVVDYPEGADGELDLAALDGEGEDDEAGSSSGRGDDPGEGDEGDLSFDPLGEPPARGLLRPWLVGAVLVVAAIIAWQLLTTTEGPAPTEPTEVATLPEPEPEPPLAEPELPPGPMSLDQKWRRGLLVETFVVEKGGTVSKALEALAFPQNRRQGLYALMERDGILSQIKPGDEFQVWWSDASRSDESLERLEYRVRPGDRPLVFIPSGESDLLAVNMAAPPKKIHQATQGVVADSFWAAGEKAGLEPWVILHLVDLMASQVDFVSDIQKGDDFQLLFLGEYQEGRLIQKPVIEMIRMTNGSRKYEFYRHLGDDGQEGYYDSQFKSIHTNFFKSPLQYSRISSGFSRARRHPILKIVRPHLGVDYAAPQGTPVSAVADGVVRSAGFRGDYGRLVVLDHDGEYRTMYGHLSKIAKGLAPGVKVSQGDLLGNVGMSGLATGPHLDFRLLHKGEFVDPEEVLKAQEGRPLPAEERVRFAEVVTRDQELLRRLLEGS